MFRTVYPKLCSAVPPGDGKKRLVRIFYTFCRCFWHKTSASLHPYNPVRQWRGVINAAVCASPSSLGGPVMYLTRRGTQPALSFPVCFLSYSL